jgi:phenylacetate-CoA ligase
MNFGVFLKENLKNISPGLGEIINKIPYSKRPGLGSVYKNRLTEINLIKNFDQEQRQEFVFSRLKALTKTAYSNIPFYKGHYDKEEFHPEDLKSFSDLKKIPVISKNILQEWELEERSSQTKGRYIVNTGGSSGSPFSLYIEPSSMGHEWAHMHSIWGKFDYKQSDLKLVFGGRSDLKDVIEYDVVRNHFAIDIYADYTLVAIKLKQLLKKYEIKYLHGYPSSIYDFAIYCENEDIELKELLSKNLKGAFLGSEYPHKHYRETIESVFNIPTISWYGHTERAVLAFEKNEQFTYEPFLSYGFSEALSLGENNYNLIATSYYNNASPLIRYNTEDIITDVVENGGILESFKITKGREGEFVIP